MFRAARDVETSSRRGLPRVSARARETLFVSRVCNICEILFIYYNSLIFPLCRRKEVRRQGLAVFCRPMTGLFILILLAAAPASAQPADAAGADKTIAEKINAAGTEKELPKRERLYRELGDARSSAAVEALSRAALNDPEPGARVDAILALRKIGGPEALKALLAALAAEKHKGARIQAVTALGFFNSPEALAELRRTAGNDPDKDLRISAVMALSRLNDADTLAAGFDAEKDPAAKLAIVDALGRSEGGEKELKKIKTRSKDAKINERADFYTGEKKTKTKKK